MNPALRRGVLIGGVLAMVAIVAVAVLTLFGGHSDPPATATPAAAGPAAPSPTSAARQYLAALATGDTTGAGLLTDDPDASAAVLADTWNSLHPKAMRATLRDVGPGSTATYSATWTLPAGHTWSYTGTFGLVLAGGAWRVHWTPAVLYPGLAAGQRLVIVTQAADHPVVVDQDGRPLVTAGAGGTRVADPDFALLRSALVQPLPAGVTSTFALERVDASGHDVQTLLGSPSGAGKPVRSTVSTAMQSVAQSVVDGYQGPAVLLALRPSDGALLVAAQNDRSTESPFTGLYAPGSTFKIVTATAALQTGTATEESALPCPLTAVIGTRRISNEGFALGTTTMREAFAKSCNTTFGQLAHQLPVNGLTDAANEYGLGADFTIPGLDTQTGSVGPAADSDQQVEDGIGQGTVQVSPFGEVLMAATVAAGHHVVPRLWRDLPTGVTTGYAAPPASVLDPVRSMMRAVVTEGTGTAVAQSGTVYGKTGTAQFGSGDDANGWFVGYRGDLAFVVFLQGADDSRPAVSLAAKFLAGVPSS